MDWQPIETAPKDGTKILVFCPWLGVCGPATWDICQYATKPKPFWTHWGERIWGTSRVRIDQPTHWMPMPEGPNVRVNRHFAVGHLGIVVVEAAGVAIPFHALTFTHDNREVYVFFCLWEDRGGASGRAENTTGWSRLAGFESVRRGERNLGQQVLEIVLSGYANATEAQAALKRELPKLVKKS